MVLLFSALACVRVVGVSGDSHDLADLPDAVTLELGSEAKRWKMSLPPQVVVSMFS
jgi:hypothetical protein